MNDAPLRLFQVRKMALHSSNERTLEFGTRGHHELRLKGVPIAKFALDELTIPTEVILPDGVRITLQLIPAYPSPDLEVLQDGRPLRGCDTDPFERLKQAGALHALLALFCVFVTASWVVAAHRELSMFCGLLILANLWAARAFRLASPSCVVIGVAAALPSIAMYGVTIGPILNELELEAALKVIFAVGLMATGYYHLAFKQSRDALRTLLSRAP